MKMTVHRLTPWPAGSACPRGGALHCSNGKGGSVHTFPPFAPAGVDTGDWVQGTGDLWLPVLFDHVRVQRAALPPAMEWTSHSWIPSATLILRAAREVSTSIGHKSLAGHCPLMLRPCPCFPKSPQE